MSIPAVDWVGLLTQWSRDVLATPEEVAGLPPDVVASGWLGYPSATEERIAAAEARLGTTLPPTYRTFLTLTNGWRKPQTMVERLWSTEEIDWLAALDQEGIDAWISGEEYVADGPLSVPTVPDAEYFAYVDGAATGEMRSEYLQTALQISAVEYAGTAVYLLNPRVVTPEGEWEAWLWAHWLPGARRYRSFWDMMRHEHDTHVRVRNEMRKRSRR